ncbi:MAG: S9 family peptidase [Candidatus Wallbacteria bacterium HGW-Wallbacteria-1]|uniref:S9 family peptidase n=1 Tax=Candidatus Wallbacteria bacterium HGW-Wallbacteria-1 TaxID=2013854 RepID=A0A2N1PNX7_9BACT|nr:MAG: S9 family peptidase [Candidatus Wallbacteria bacterium HGW-Wallbacteria-1]
MTKSSFSLFCIMLLLFIMPTLHHAFGAETMIVPRLIPLNDFFKNPTSGGFQLSPDGKHIAFLKPWMNRMNIHIMKAGESVDNSIRITSAQNRDIPDFLWVNNERVVYIQDQGGDEDYKAYGVNIDGSNPKVLTPFPKTRVTFVDDLEDDDNHILIGLNRRNPRIFDVYRLNVNSGKMKMVAENPGNVAGWLTDHDGQLRIAVTSDGVNSSILYRPTEKDKFKLVITTSFKDQLFPLRFTPDNKLLYVASNIDRDKSAIFLYDPSTGKHGDLIFEHPEVDVNRLISSIRTKKVTGVTYVTDKRHYHFFDKGRANVQSLLEKLIPGVEVVVTDFSRDEHKLLVRSYSDKTLGAWYLYDRLQRRLTKLIDVSPWLDSDEMANMQPITFQSRDGLTIHGYLTLPIATEATNLPIVLNPHGGPWVRDSWGFNPEVQFLANRGYGVLQINYRGSTGYGKKFWTSSFKQWGLKMQDDLTDGVQWLIDKGIADPSRVAIYGASYGGYATLAGLAFTPDLYACGVDYVGVSNIFTLLETLPPYWELGRKKMYEMIGDPETEKELLKAASPVFHADKIVKPLLVVQGANDPRVKKAEADQIVHALRDRGIDVPYMVKDNEGHGFRNEENRFHVYKTMEAFLARHIGGLSETEPDVLTPLSDTPVDNSMLKTMKSEK